MKIIHIGIHNSQNRNSGDTLLFEETRKLFERNFRHLTWDYLNLWENVNTESLDKINKSDLVLIGGGGLFLKDQKGAENSVSGWQWNCSIDTLSRIETPIVVFGVGYNRFRGQEDFDNTFTHNINMLAQKTIFFGLRNTGSILAMKSYLEPQFHHKLYKQTCPTTIMPYTSDRRIQKDKEIICFNLAYDRPQFRFGKAEKNILTKIGFALSIIVKKGFSLDICCHKDMDREIVKYLPQDIEFREVNLTDSSSEEIIDYYKNIDLAIGLRGHSQLIPFGLNKKIISIISHNKLGYFLEDIKKSDLGVDVNEENLDLKIIELFEKVMEDKHLVEDLKNAKMALIEETLENFKVIKSKLSNYEY